MCAGDKCHSPELHEAIVHDELDCPLGISLQKIELLQESVRDFESSNDRLQSRVNELECAVEKLEQKLLEVI